MPESLFNKVTLLHGFPINLAEFLEHLFLRGFYTRRNFCFTIDDF